MKNMKRALRRHHRARMIHKAEKTEMFFWRGDEDKELVILKLFNHLKNCSCYMCGNQRHNDWQPNDEMLTMQERKAKEDCLDQMNHI